MGSSSARLFNATTAASDSHYLATNYDQTKPPSQMIESRVESSRGGISGLQFGMNDTDFNHHNQSTGSQKSLLEE